MYTVLKSCSDQRLCIVLGNKTAYVKTTFCLYIYDKPLYRNHQSRSVDARMAGMHKYIWGEGVMVAQLLSSLPACGEPWGFS